MKVTRSLVRAVMIGLALAALAGGCATQKGISQARQSDELRDYDTAVARYSKVLREHPGNQEAQLGLERAKLRASEAHLLRGRRLFQIGKYDDAVLELQIASDLNPTSGDAERDLRAARAAVRAKLAAPAEGKTALETLLSRTRDLPAAGYELPNVRLANQIVTGSQATSRQVYLAIARMANLSVTFDPTFRDAAAPVSLLNQMTVKQALDAVARAPARSTR
jgi:tetratricopeptide (TPR) repeat protein